LSGTVDVGTLDVAPGALDIGTGATVVAGGALVQGQVSAGNSGSIDVTVSGVGAALIVAGTLAFDGDVAINLIANLGAAVSAGSLSFSPTDINSMSIAVDSTSAVEIGTGGSAVAGSVTIAMTGRRSQPMDSPTASI
jgi:hypothetical protein